MFRVTRSLVARRRLQLSSAVSSDLQGAMEVTMHLHHHIHLHLHLHMHLHLKIHIHLHKHLHLPWR